MKWTLTLLAMAIATHAQSDPDQSLQRARARIKALTKPLDRYVCIETIDRAYYWSVQKTELDAPPSCTSPAPAASWDDLYQLASTDRVRLEVTLSQSHELHSWPGATGFDTRAVDQIIGNGPVSSGNFALYVSTIFESPGALFRYLGEEVEDGRKRLRYSYEVPEAASRFELKSGGPGQPLAIHGDFLIDKDTFELTRLTIQASQPPSSTGLCAVSNTLEFHIAQIGDGQVLIPRRGRLEIVHQNGQASRNDTTFGDCREYRAESEVVFDTPAHEPGGQTQQRRARVTLPLGLPVTLSLLHPIDSETAATGDPVSARVVKAVRRPGATDDLLPAGVIVHGRIRRMEHHLLPEPYFLIALSFNRMEIDGALAPFAARHEANPKLVRQLDAQLSLRATGIWFWDVGNFLFPTGKPRYTLPAGFESSWFTLAIGPPPAAP